MTAVGFLMLVFVVLVPFFLTHREIDDLPDWLLGLVVIWTAAGIVLLSVGLARWLWDNLP